jgi:predicted amidophosphoribosyltransferase
MTWLHIIAMILLVGGSLVATRQMLKKRQVETKRCVKCGSNIELSYKHCGNCGAKLWA